MPRTIDAANTMQTSSLTSAEPSPSSRLMSLDVFRGATIAAMMLVNNPGDWSAAYSPLLHASWHGWTFTDTVFPFFLWIVGVAIPLSIVRRLEQGQSRRELFTHAVRRAAILFGLGLFLNSFGYLIDGSLLRDGLGDWLHHYLTTVRIPGVLQRIAVCYLAAIAVFLLTEVRGQIITVGALLLVYWLLMALVPVPGYGAGVLEKEGNFSQFIDNLLLNGPLIGTHVWKSSGTWDPEGIVSTLPAIATCLFGVLTGHLLRQPWSPAVRTSWIFTGGSVLMFAGQLMHLWLPINKNIWTSSYSIFMAGLAMVCFGVCYWIVDVQGWRRWARPLAIYGMNAITVFVLAGILGRLTTTIKVGGKSGDPMALKTLLYNLLFAPIPDPKVASLAWALMYVGILYAVAWYMYRRKWFVKF